MIAKAYLDKLTYLLVQLLRFTRLWDEDYLKVCIINA